MGKKNRSASSFQTKTIHQLKNLNDQLVKEVTECRKQIEQLQFQIAILVSHHNIDIAESERDTSSIVKSECEASPNFTEAAAHGNTEMELLDVYIEKDEIQSNMNHIIEEKDCTIPCLEQPRTIEDAGCGGGRKWKKWICSAALATASFSVVAAVVTLCSSKSSNPKN
ncbi:hypothetical protein MA16_Dca027986 [Dendrobium catenatum]|uniref:Uncharacterized protein n=1 Tax=Dendrobium catenatum TaxID=906689 RepID=A0A2I0VAC5_9ASPA|nr:hypothetical protein MA16_Dca027986 [Dendrobium catenatum]